MKSISLDFSNNMICFMTDGQQGTEFNFDMKQIAFNSFVPEKYRNYTSYTWDFEKETFAANQEYTLKDGAIMTEHCFVPIFIVPMPGLAKRYNEFIAILGYEEVETKSLFPESLRRLLGIE